MTKKYLHTLDGEPATFCERDKTIYKAGRSKHSAANLANSLSEIYKQQKQSARTRLKLLGENRNKKSEGWVAVMV